MSQQQGQGHTGMAELGQAQQLLSQLSPTKFSPSTSDANMIQLAIANALVGIGLALNQQQGETQQGQTRY